MSEPPKPSAKPSSTRDDALAVVRQLREADHVAYFAGGCVRDALLGLKPTDYDVATDAKPDRVRELFRRTQAVGAAFGVILVRQGRSQIEVATFRTDLKYVDGRRPEGVVFSTAEEDAKRRDFTINGMFFDPIEEKVIDFVGGQEDVQTRTLRAIGNPDARFAEDHLRLLRAVRFSARFGLAIDPATAEAIARHAEHLKRISPERIGEELRLMLGGAGRVSAVRLLRRSGLDRVIFRVLPSVAEPVGIFESLPGEYHAFGVALAALVLDARGGTVPTKSDVRAASQALRQALKISNDEVEEVERALSFAHLLSDPPPTVATLKRFLAGRPAGARELLAAMVRCGIMRDRVSVVLERLGQIEAAGFSAPPPLVTGDDLTAAGLTPGPVFKRALDETYDAQLEGRVTTKQEALEMALRVARGN